MMLMQPKQELSAGEDIVVQLELDNGKSLSVSFKVTTDITTEGHGHGSHSKHSSDDEKSDKKDHNKHQNH